MTPASPVATNQRLFAKRRLCRRLRPPSARAWLARLSFSQSPVANRVSVGFTIRLLLNGCFRRPPGDVADPDCVERHEANEPECVAQDDPNDESYRQPDDRRPVVRDPATARCCLIDKPLACKPLAHLELTPPPSSGRGSCRPGVPDSDTHTSSSRSDSTGQPNSVSLAGSTTSDTGFSTVSSPFATGTHPYPVLQMRKRARLCALAISHSLSSLPTDGYPEEDRGNCFASPTTG